MKQYLAIIEKTQEGFSAYLPDFPHCKATATTEEEIRLNIETALQLHLQALAKANRAIPQPAVTSTTYVTIENKKRSPWQPPPPAVAKRYLLVIECTDHGYTSYFPDSPGGGCSRGRTPKEIAQNAPRALERRFRELERLGREIPEPACTATYIDVEEQRTEQKLQKSKVTNLEDRRRENRFHQES